MEISVDQALEKIKKILMAEGERDLYLNVKSVIRSHFEKECLRLENNRVALELKSTELQNTLAENREKARIRESMVFDKSAYWVRDGDKKDGPFCYRCWHKTGTLIRMNPCDDPGWSECLRCKSREQTGA